MDGRALGMRQVDAAVDHRIAGLADRWKLLAEWQAGAVAGIRRACTHSQAGDRFHLSKFQPDRRSHRVRKRGTALNLSRHGGSRASAPCTAGARTRGDGAPYAALSLAALGRSAAARRSGARLRWRAADPA